MIFIITYDFLFIIEGHNYQIKFIFNKINIVINDYYLFYLLYSSIILLNKMGNVILNDQLD